MSARISFSASRLYSDSRSTCRVFAHDGPGREQRMKSSPQRHIFGIWLACSRIGAFGCAMVFRVLIGTPGADQGTAWLIAMKPPFIWLHSRATPGCRSISIT